MLERRAHARGLMARIDERALERVEQRVTALHVRSGRRVASVGHSRDCHLARAIAARPPELVSHGADAAA